MLILPKIVRYFSLSTVLGIGLSLMHPTLAAQEGKPLNVDNNKIIVHKQSINQLIKKPINQLIKKSKWTTEIFPQEIVFKICGYIPKDNDKESYLGTYKYRPLPDGLKKFRLLAKVFANYYGTVRHNSARIAIGCFNDLYFFTQTPSINNFNSLTNLEIKNSFVGDEPSHIIPCNIMDKDELKKLRTESIPYRMGFVKFRRFEQLVQSVYAHNKQPSYPNLFIYLEGVNPELTPERLYDLRGQLYIYVGEGTLSSPPAFQMNFAAFLKNSTIRLKWMDQLLTRNPPPQFLPGVLFEKLYPSVDKKMREVKSLALLGWDCGMSLDYLQVHLELPDHLHKKSLEELVLCFPPPGNSHLMGGPFRSFLRTYPSDSPFACNKNFYLTHNMPHNKLRDAIPAPKLLDSLSLLRNLRTLNLASNKLTDANLPSLTILSRLSSLENLDLSDSYFTSQSAASVLPFLTTLKKLSINENNIGSGDDPSFHSKDFLCLTNLKSLELRNCTIERGTLGGLSSLINLTKLKVLSSCDNDGKYTPFDLPELKLPSLERLEMIEYHLTHIKFVPPLHNLTYLNLSYNKIADIKPVSSLSGLTYLNLCHNKIADIKPVSSLSGLIYLNLSESNIAEVLPLASLTNLTYLNLLGSNIAEIPSLASLTNLTYLDLSENKKIFKNISEEGRLKYLSSLKQLKILVVSDFDGQDGADATRSYLPSIFRAIHPSQPYLKMMYKLEYSRTGSSYGDCFFDQDNDGQIRIIEGLKGLSLPPKIGKHALSN